MLGTTLLMVVDDTGQSQRPTTHHGVARSGFISEAGKKFGLAGKRLPADPPPPIWGPLARNRPDWE